jgi:hypothetical protein
VGPGRLQPSNRVIVGIALVLFAAVIEGVGIHHLIRTGTCSSTGYIGNLGPVQKCPAGTGAWIGFLIGGIFLVLIGGFLSAPAGLRLIIPAIFCAIGFGSLTVAFDKAASSGSKTFGLIFGACFAISGVIPALLMGWSGVKRLGRSAGASRAPARSRATSPPVTLVPTVAAGPRAVAAAGLGATDAAAAFGGVLEKPDAILSAYNAPSDPAAASPSAPSTPTGSAPRGDVFDKIAKLAALHTSGALTDEEFQREKAKLLGEL